MNDSSDLYKIGTVAKLTGIAVERLRAWERRYGLTPAQKEGKTRYFSTEQVERLTRIKRLIDQGHPVSTLINLDSDALNERLLQIQPEARATSVDRTPQIGLVGTQLLMLEQSLTDPVRVDVTGRWVNTTQALADLAQQAIADRPPLLVTLLGSLSAESLAELDALAPHTQPLLIYHYATESGLLEASERQWDALRWPVTWSDIEHAIARSARTPLRAGRRANHHFSDEQLLNIASSGTAAMGCACPADLVNLISALNAFSDHAAACATAAPQRAAAHAPAEIQAHHQHIAERTSQARLELELVLEDWVNASTAEAHPS